MWLLYYFFLSPVNKKKNFNIGFSISEIIRLYSFPPISLSTLPFSLYNRLISPILLQLYFPLFPSPLILHSVRIALSSHYSPVFIFLFSPSHFYLVVSSSPFSCIIQQPPLYFIPKLTNYTKPRSGDVIASWGSHSLSMSALIFLSLSPPLPVLLSSRPFPDIVIFYY